MHQYDYLIIGGGMTGDAAAQGIRELDTSGTIGMLSRETDATYNRPPLSKALWKGDAESSIWRTTPGAVTLHLGRSAVSIDHAAHVVTDDQGESYRYGKLLLATGGTPRKLPFSTDGFIYYRTLADYHALRGIAAEHDRFAVIGGGFIGSEIAAALALNGKQVTMLFPEDAICARVFPADLARFVTAYYREKGVRVQTGASVKGASVRDGVTELTTGEGQTVAADAVVAGLGITPETSLVEAAGAKVENGVPVDERLRTSLPDVYAAGDVASFESRALGRRMRVEHEDNANTMGRAAGRSMAGDTTPYEHLPFFYSDLFDLGYEAVGILDSRLTTFEDWKEKYKEGVIYYLDSGRVVGTLLWNVWGKVDEARAIISEGSTAAPESLRGRL